MSAGGLVKKTGFDGEYEVWNDYSLSTTHQQKR
jgi:hypothetical protein